MKDFKASLPILILIFVIKFAVKAECQVSVGAAYGVKEWIDEDLSPYLDELSNGVFLDVCLDAYIEDESFYGQLGAGYGSFYSTETYKSRLLDFYAGAGLSLPKRILYGGIIGGWARTFQNKIGFQPKGSFYYGIGLGATPFRLKRFAMFIDSKGLIYFDDLSNNSVKTQFYSLQVGAGMRFNLSN